MVFALSVVVAVAFSLMALAVLIGFLKKSPAGQLCVNRYTVIVPVKDDYDSAARLLAVLKQYIPVKCGVRVCIADDHSREIPASIPEQISGDSRFEIIYAPEGISGKKAVLDYAIKRANSDWVMLLDADTHPHPTFFERGISGLDSQTRLVLFPLRPSASRKLYRAFFDLDFLSLQIAGIGSAKLHRAVLANGALLLVSRAAYLQTRSLRDDWSISSGDDVFMMFAILKKYGSRSVAVLPSMRPVSGVKFPEGFRRLWKQRLRWMGKSDAVSSLTFQSYAWTVLFAQLVVGWGGFMFIKFGWVAEALPAVLIVMAESILLLMACAFYDRRDLMLFIFPAVIIYPFYLFALVLTRIFVRPEWK